MLGLSRRLALAGLVAGSAAACGPVATNGAHPMLDLPTSSAQPSVASASPSATPPDAPFPVRPRGEKNTSVVPSRFDKEISALGLDPRKLPLFASLTLEQKKGLMPLFAKSLGYAKDGDPGCAGCHVAGDYKLPTRNRGLSRQMYDRWSVGLEIDLGSQAVGPTRPSGATLFCDSCHESKSKVLDRSNADVLKAFMKAEYEGKLLRRDELPMSCATCHGDELEIAIFDKVWKAEAASTVTAPDPNAPTRGVKRDSSPHSKAGKPAPDLEGRQ